MNEEEVIADDGDGERIQVSISNCNNIKKCNLSLLKKGIAVLYGVNGTGKTTIARAIEAISTDASELSLLCPFDAEEGVVPSCSINIDFEKVMIFNERYVDNYMFKEDELMKGGYEVFIRDEKCLEYFDERDGIVASARSKFLSDDKLNELIYQLGQFIKSFGPALKSGKLSKSSKLIKASKHGNLIGDISPSVADYAEFIQGDSLLDWIKWQNSGGLYAENASHCPYCSDKLSRHKSALSSLREKYDKKTVEELSKWSEVFAPIRNYLSDDAKALIDNVVACRGEIDETDARGLCKLRDEAEFLQSCIEQLRAPEFCKMPKNPNEPYDLSKYVIAMSGDSAFSSDEALEVIGAVNESLYSLESKLAAARKKYSEYVNQAERMIDGYCATINNFMRGAGYNYRVSVRHTDDLSEGKIILRYGEGDTAISGLSDHLSYGEKNALALAIFVLQASKENADLVIFDDPISSFDQFKKFAILNLIESIPGMKEKPILILTHDPEVVIDFKKSKLKGSEAPIETYYLENCSGDISPVEISGSDLLGPLQFQLEVIKNMSSPIAHLVAARKYLELSSCNGSYSKTPEYNMLSSLIHGKAFTIKTDSGSRAASDEEQEKAISRIKKIDPSFDYDKTLSLVSSKSELIALYDGAETNFEKALIYRTAYEVAPCSGPGIAIDLNHADELCHIENDSVVQLNPTKFNVLPGYIIKRYDEGIDRIR